MPPPTGTNTIADFKILAHVSLKVLKQVVSHKPTVAVVAADDDPDSEYEENTTHMLPQPAELAPVWLHLNPSS
jgi:hypothetical protein